MEGYGVNGSVVGRKGGALIMANFLADIGRAQPLKAFGEGYKAIRDVMIAPEIEAERKEERALRIGGLEQQRALTTVQVESAGIDLQKKKEQREFESRGWDPDIDPIFQKWLPDDQGKAKDILSKMIPPNSQTGKWTQWDRTRAMQMIQQDAGMLTTVTQFNVNAIKSNIQKKTQQLAKAEEIGKTEDIPKLRAEIKTLSDQHDIELGKFSKITTGFEIMDLLKTIDESKMPEDVKASIQALGKANDLEGIRGVIRDYIKESTKPGKEIAPHISAPFESDGKMWQTITYPDGRVLTKPLIPEGRGPSITKGGITETTLGLPQGQLKAKPEKLTEAEKDPDANAFSKALTDAKKTEQTPLFMEKLSEAEQQRAESRLRNKTKSNYLARGGDPKKFDKFFAEGTYGAPTLDKSDIVRLKEFATPDESISHIERAFRANMISPEVRDQAISLINKNRKKWDIWRKTP